MISVIIAGAGYGKRIKNTPKAFIRIGGRELIYHSLDKFYGKTRHITVVLPAEHVRRWQDRLGKKYRNVKVVAGGATRQDSVKAGLASLDRKSGIVLVHDVARPFFNRTVLSGVISGAKRYGASVPCIPISDTVKEFKNGFIKKTLKREEIVQVQTPQAFKYSILAAAYKKACEENFFGSDDSVLVERMGQKIHVSPGSPENIKITYPADIELARILFKRWKKNNAEKE